MCKIIVDFKDFFLPHKQLNSPQFINVRRETPLLEKIEFQALMYIIELRSQNTDSIGQTSYARSGI